MSSLLLNEHTDLYGYKGTGKPLYVKQKKTTHTHTQKRKNRESLNLMYVTEKEGMSGYKARKICISE
jgi:hypothetical protein